MANRGNGNGVANNGRYYQVSHQSPRVSNNAALVGRSSPSPRHSPPPSSSTPPKSSVASTTTTTTTTATPSPATPTTTPSTSTAASSSASSSSSSSPVPSLHQHVNLTRYGSPMGSSSPSHAHNGASSSTSTAASPSTPGMCFGCGQTGHLRRECPTARGNGASSLPPRASPPSSPHGSIINGSANGGGSTPVSPHGKVAAVLTPHPPVAIGSLFDYLIVVDFEATCDEPISPAAKPTITRENQEIIEFPWVVIDVATRTIIDSKQMFVKPEWMPTLTPFCTKLTGITQDKVSNAASLSDVLISFDNYVKEQFDDRKKSFALVTDGEWDLKICLRSEAIKKKLDRAFAPHYLNYFDVKRAFAHLYRIGSMTQPKHSLKSMLSLLGIPMVGHHHSGIDDCTNIAAIVLRLMNDGYPFSHGGLTMIAPSYDPTQDMSVHDFAMGPRPAPLGGPGGTVTIEEPTGDDTEVVRVRGLPWAATEHDVKAFFGAAFPIVTVTFVLNVSKKPTGTGFVEFSSADVAAASRVRHNHSMGHRYIEIFRSNRDQRTSVCATTWH